MQEGEAVHRSMQCGLCSAACEYVSWAGAGDNKQLHAS